MSNVIQNWVVPKWTATRSDIEWPSTYLFVGLVASIVLYTGYSVPYVAADTSPPQIVSTVAFVVFFIVVPLLSLRESTEILFDGLRVSMRVVGGGFLLFTGAFWVADGATEGLSAFSSAPLLVTFSITVTGLYGMVMLGFLWVLQFTRQGTSGVESEF